MINLAEFFTKGLKNSLQLKNNGAISHNGPWINLYTNTLMDRWHVNDFSSAEYTISADLNNENKEIVKVLITATADDAHLVEYARNSTNIDIIDIEALVNNSYVDVIISPKITKTEGAKVIFTANYFQNQNPQI